MFVDPAVTCAVKGDTRRRTPRSSLGRFFRMGIRTSPALGNEHEQSNHVARAEPWSRSRSGAPMRNVNVNLGQFN